MAILSENLFYDFVVLLITAIALVIAFFKRKFSYWERVGLVQVGPSIPFGNAANLFLGRTSMAEFFRDHYQDFKARGFRHGGVYLGLKPMYVPTDLELVKRIMQIDFSHFMNHGVYVDEVNDPLTGHLFSLEDAKWRNLRVKLTPTFTSGKMKMMFQTLADCTVGLTEIMDRCANKNEEIDIREILARFTTDIIGSVAFGIECNSLREPDSKFRKFGKKIFNPPFKQKISNMFQFFIPHNILKAMKYKITDSEVEEFFLKTVRDTVAYREENNIYRKDFMHLLLQLKNRGFVADDDQITDDKEKTQETALTLNELAAQCFIFFVAGFETSSTTMTFALYELAMNMVIQEKLRNEINSVLEKYDNKLTYNGIKEMTYMDQVINETLRKYPPLATLLRQCNKDYMVPGTDICIKKGTDVAISALGLHTDPEYFPNPEVFDPERFSEENKNNVIPFTWIPFGEGPRICIGLRFGLMQSKVGLTALLKNYKITLNPKTQSPLKFNPEAFITTAQGEVWLNVEKIDQNS